VDLAAVDGLVVELEAAGGGWRFLLSPWLAASAWSSVLASPGYADHATGRVV
jgi:hypothetical protein